MQAFRLYICLYIYTYVSLAVCRNVYLNRTARKKVTTGTELLVADATVAEVYLRLMLYRFMLNVFLQINSNITKSFQIKYPTKEPFYLPSSQ